MSNAALELAFKRLAHAVQSGDLDAYRALARDPSDAFQQQLFERNSAMIKKAGMSLSLRKITLAGEQAVVTFAVLDPKGTQVEQGEMTFADSKGIWKVIEL